MEFWGNGITTSGAPLADAQEIFPVPLHYLFMSSDPRSPPPLFTPPNLHTYSFFAESCFVGNQEYVHGQEWRPTLCTKCVCTAGATQCFTIECQPVFCHPHENLQIHPGECCPVCVPSYCQMAGREYEHGQQWQGINGIICMCERGQVLCHSWMCPPNADCKDQTMGSHVGQGLQNTSSKVACIHGSVVRYHGEVWNSNGCKFCTCMAGSVLCREAQRSNLECRQGEEAVHLPGRCYPECQSTQPACFHRQQVKKNKEVWWEGPCRQCECLNSRVTCYHLSCPSCPSGTQATHVRGECFPHHPGCWTWSRTLGHCDRCADTSAILHHQRCLLFCPSSFYRNSGRCAGMPPFSLRLLIDHPERTTSYCFLMNFCCISNSKQIYHF
ncbi:extracellular matrix protein FRAS1-like [Arapaima gigas]